VYKPNPAPPKAKAVLYPVLAQLLASVPTTL